MATSRIILLQRAVGLLSVDVMFRNRWARCSSIKAAVEKRYELSNVDISKKNISIAVGKLESCSSNLQAKNSSGIYSGVRRHERYFWFQDKDKPPPIFPRIGRNNDEWLRVDEEDRDRLEGYMARISRQADMRRESKKRRLDAIDIYDMNNDNHKKIKSLASNTINSSSFNFKFDFWDSPEAHKLFNVGNDDSVLQVLVDRCSLLSKSSFDDSVLISILHDVNDIAELSTSQLEYLRYNCLYLQKAYENAAQFMNSLTWVQCVNNCIKEMEDIGIHHIANEKTIRMLNSRK